MSRGTLKLQDVFAALLLVLLVGGMVAVGQAQLTEREERLLCQRNLSQLGKGLLLYSNENKGSFPRTVYENTGKVTAFTQPNKDAKATSADPYGKDPRPEANDITAAMFRLLTTQNIPAESFVCPATDDLVDQVGPRPEMTRMNFASPYHLSYSLVNVYPGQDAIGKGYKTFITAFGSDFAVAGDLNPGGEVLTRLTPTSPAAEIAKGNSPNHQGVGQNVLYADGHAEFVPTPFAGVTRATPGTPGRPGRRDNIFTYGETTEQSGGLGVSGSPVDRDDSVLLPTAADRGPRPRAGGTTAREAATRQFAGTTRPTRDMDPRSFLGREMVAPTGQTLRFLPQQELDFKTGGETLAGRWMPLGPGRFRVVLMVDGKAVVHYYTASVRAMTGEIVELVDEQGVKYTPAERQAPDASPTTLPSLRMRQ